MAQSPWFVFAGGGTGGHLFPALGVVERLRERDEAIDVSFFCTQRPSDREFLHPFDVEAIPLTVQPLPRHPWRWPGFLLRWRESLQICRKAFTARRPAAVIGAGGYASGPPVAAALKMGIPTFLLNPDAVPGRANQHLARRHTGTGNGLTGIFAQWEVTRRHFPPAAPVLVTGCPVRKAFEDAVNRSETGRREFRQSFGLEPDRPTLLVTGASQGARTVNEALMRLAGQLARSEWQVLHLSGPGDRDRLKAAYQPAGVRAEVLTFTPRMPEAMAAADLILSRAGASSLAEILAMGRPSILFPYPYHRDQHQRHNGAVLVEAGAAVMLEDVREPEGNARALEPVLEALMRDADRRDRMTEAARNLGRPNAAPDIAERLMAAARPADEQPIRSVANAV